MTGYMKEAKRLAQAYADAVLLGEGNDEALAALLAHIQRGAVPEGWQVVPSADQLWNNDEVMALNAELGLTMDQLSRLASAITRIAHPADWRERFSQAVYDDLAAADNQDFPLEEYPARILKVLDAVIGREIKPAPAEVPMPDDDIMRDALEHLAGLDTHDVNLRDNPKAYEVLERLVRTYGAACRAAGEAAGYARGLKEADKLLQALRDIADPIAAYERDLPPGYTLDGAACVRMADNPETYRRMAREAIADLREEVKP